jgi:plasmid stabilization system protein ParE
VRVEFTDRARTDVDEAFSWYAARSTAALEGFVRSLDHAVAVVSSGPEIWPLFEAETRRYLFPRYPYSLVYHIEDETILVVAVASQRRRPGYWK